MRAPLPNDPARPNGALDELLAALSAPLKFLAAAPPAAAARTHLPTATFIQRAQALLPQVPPGPVRHDLEALCAELAAYEGAAVEHGERCRTLPRTGRGLPAAPRAPIRTPSQRRAQPLPALFEGTVDTWQAGPSEQAPKKWGLLRANGNVC